MTTTKTRTSGNTAETAAPGKQPTHRLYIVLGEGEKAVWRPIGAGWSHGDGKGFNLNVEALPLQGRLVLREVKPKTDGSADQGRLV